MALVLTTEEVEQLLEMKDVVERLEVAYKDLAENKAGTRHRTDIVCPTLQKDVYYGFKSMDGVVPRFKTAAIRLNSDIINMVQMGEKHRRVKIPSAPGNRYVGLVLLFSTETGELLAIFPDRALQRMRVGATNGLGAKYMSREESSVYGLIGSGWQAGGQLMAMCAVRPIKKVKVYSTNEDRRRLFAENWARRLSIDIEPVDSAEKAMRGSDIVGCATSFSGTVTESRYIDEGTFVTSVKHSEIDPETIKKSGLAAILWKENRHKTIFVGDKSIFSRGIKEYASSRTDIDITAFPELMHIICGEIKGRNNDREITTFINNIGLGLQFAAVGSLVYEKARQKGAGKMLPNEWFSEIMKT